MKKLIGGFLATIFAVGMFNFVSVYAQDNGNGWANGCCEQEEGCFLQADALIWKACRSGLDYALEVDTTSGLQNGRVHALSFDWNVGFRAALGYRLDCDRWDIRLVYTRFHSDVTGSVTDCSLATGTGADLNQPIFFQTRYHPYIDPNTNGEDPIGAFEKASGKFELGYDVVDLLLGHSFCPCPSFELRPYGGIRGMFLKQDLIIDYKGNDFAATGDRVVWASDLNAFGIHGGTEVYYHICGDFSLYGNFAGSVVVGKPDGHQKQTTTDTINRTTPPSTWTLDIFEAENCLMSCGYDAALGIMWERCCGDTVVALTVGYELHQWNTITEQRRYYNCSHYGISSDMVAPGLGFHGAFIRGRVDF